MEKTRKSFLILSSIGIISFFAFTGVSFAQTSTAPAEGLTISPPMYELNLDKGEEVSYKIQVTNPTKNLIELYPSAMDFQASGEGGQPNFIDPASEGSKFSIGNWITFDVPKIALLPEQVVEFQFTIHVPENAEPGGHYGVVFLATKPPEKNEGASQVSLSSKVGSLLLVRIPGEIKESAAVEEFSAPWFYFSPPVNFTVFIRNNGNIHFKPQGDIAIRNWRGKEVQRITINPTRNNVLPESHRKFESAWNPKNNYFWQEPFGRFSADLTMVYGENVPLKGIIHFWIIPWWFIITAGSVLLVALLLIAIKIIKRKKKKQRGQLHSSLFQHPTDPHSHVKSAYFSMPSDTAAHTSTFPEEEPYDIQNRNRQSIKNKNEFNTEMPAKNKRIMRF